MRQRLGIITILMLGTILLLEKAEAVSLHSPSYPIILSYWWETPSQPSEKWLSPKREDDEWYKQHHKRKYRKESLRGRGL